MKKILIVEGLCAWNAFITKTLVAEGYRIRKIRALTSLWSPLKEFQADLVLIGLGVRHDHAWHLLRQLKAHDAKLPVLIYQVVNGRGVEDLKKTVDAALAEAARKRERFQKMHRWQPTVQMAI